MKTQVLKIGVLALFTVATFSCKENKEAEEAKEVVEAEATATTYTIDTNASSIEWMGQKPTGTHSGTINIAKGEVAVNDGVVAAGNFVIDMKTINCKDLDGDQKANLEAHLMGTVEGKEGDFFNVNKYPTAMFQLTGVFEKEGIMMVEGNLTIKEKTNNISFPATVNMDGDKMMLKSESFTIDRTQWDVNYGSQSIFDNLGDKFISDDITLTIALIGTKA